MVHFFCPGCWIEVKEDARRCEDCGFDLSAYQGRSFEDKLLLALRGPVRETQGMAVYLLGRLGSEKALAAFEEILASSSDPYLVRQVIEALAHMPRPQSGKLLGRALHHPSVLVSEAARVATAANSPLAPGGRTGRASRSER